MKRFVLSIFIISIFCSTAYAIIPALGFGLSAVAQQIVRGTAFKLIQRGFNPADPRFVATTGAIVSTLSSRLKIEGSIGLAAIVGFSLINNDSGLHIQSQNNNYTLQYDGEQQIQLNGVTYSTNSEIPNSAFDESLFADSPCSANCRYEIASSDSSSITFGQQNFIEDGTGGGHWAWAGQYRAISFSNSQPYTVTQPATSPIPADLPDELMSLPIPDQSFADLINNLWNEAANAPGYEGITPTLSDPVTPADISASVSQAGGVRVKVADVLAPPKLDAYGNPIFDVNLTDGNPTEHLPNTSPTEVSETAPEIPTPTISSPSLDPLIQPFLDLKNRYAVNFEAPQASCPLFSFNILNSAYATTIHCELFAAVSPVITIMMLVVWTFIGFRIVMDA